MYFFEKDQAKYVVQNPSRVSQHEQGVDNKPPSLFLFSSGTKNPYAFIQHHRTYYILNGILTFDMNSTERRGKKRQRKNIIVFCAIWTLNRVEWEFKRNAKVCLKYIEGLRIKDKLFGDEGKEIKKEEAKKRGVKLCRSSYKEENGRVLVRNAGYDDDEEMRRMVIWWWWGMCSMCIWSLAFHTHVISQVMPKIFLGDGDLWKFCDKFLPLFLTLYRYYASFIML